MGDDDRTRRLQFLRRQHLGPKGAPDEQNWRPGIEDLEDTPFGGLGVWRQIGPAPLDVHHEQLINGIGPAAGEVLDIAFDPTGGGLSLYLATNGGVWKSDDGGLAWTPLTDMLPTASIGAIAVDPADTTIVYGGTRNLVDGTGIVPRAMGVWRSDDGGKTWAPLDGGPDATVLGNGINRIICPSPGVVLIGCTDGLFVSIDGGSHFGANPPTFDDLQPVRAGFISALEVDTGFRVARRIDGTAPESQTSPVIVVQCTDHGFETDNTVSIGGAADENANGTWDIERLDDNRFRLAESSGAPTGGAAGGFVVGPNHPSVRPIQSVTLSATKPIVITSSSHALVTGDIVVIGRVGGAVTAATGTWSIHVLTDDTFELVGSKGTGSVTGTGTVEGPRHAAQLPITSSANVVDGIELEVPNHKLVDGDRVDVRGLPGITIAAGSGIVKLVQQPPNHLVVQGLKMSVASQGAGGTVHGPAAAWNMAYFAVAGRTPDGSAAYKTSGLFRLALTSDGHLVLSDDLTAKLKDLKGKYDHLVFAQATLAPEKPSPQPRTIYLGAQTTHPRTRFVNLFRSDDYGGAWTSVAPQSLKDNLNKDGTDGSDDTFTLGVDPQDANRVYLGMKQLWRSLNGGTAWLTEAIKTEGGDLRESLNNFAHSPSTGTLHFDHHAIAFVPATHWPAPTATTPPTPVYIGTAGGVARTDDGAATFTHLNQGLAISLAMSVDVGRGPSNNDLTVAGIHHAGIANARAPSEYPWAQGLAGDGGPVAIDPFNPRLVYGFVDGQFVRSATGGEQWLRPTTRQPIVTNVHNFQATQIDTLGHPFKPQQVITVSEVRSGGTLVNEVNGSRTALSDDGAIILLKGVRGDLLPVFDRVATAFGSRFLREIAITKVTSGSPIKVETGIPHGVNGTTIVRVEGVRSVPAANNDASHLTWTATPDGPAVLSLTGPNAPPLAAQEEHGGRIRIADGSGEAPIQSATNDQPIVVTAVNHGFVTGQTITISFVRSNTNANVVDKTITVIDRNSFSIDGVDGNSPFGAQPAVDGFPIGYNLPRPDRTGRQCLALAPRLVNEHTFVIFASVGKELFRSEDSGSTFQTVKQFDDEISALATPNDISVWIGLAGSGSRGGTVRFSDGRSDFTRTNFVSKVGGRGAISAVAVDPLNSLRVAVAVSGYSDLHRQRGTHHVFLTKTGGIESNLLIGSTWEELRLSPVFEPGLPDLPFHSAAFVKAAGTSELLVASDGGVLRRSFPGTWERDGANLPTISCQSLSVDNGSADGIVRVATYGRGVWELQRPQEARLVVRTSLGFGDRPQNKTAKLPLALHNAGRTTLTISQIDVQEPGGATNFAVPGQTSIILVPGGRQKVDVTFTPTSLDFHSALIIIHSDAPGQPTLTVDATGTGVLAGAPRVSVRTNKLRFGFVLVKDVVTVKLPLTISNSGTGDATIKSVDLVPPGHPAITLSLPNQTPFDLPAGESVTVDVELAPTTNGPVKATLRIESQPVGSTQPTKVLDVFISGEGTTKSKDVLASVMHSLGLADEPEGVTV